MKQRGVTQFDMMMHNIPTITPVDGLDSSGKMVMEANQHVNIYSTWTCTIYVPLSGMVTATCCVYSTLESSMPVPSLRGKMLT